MMADECQHDMQVTDDGVLHGGFVGEADDVLSEEHFEAVTEERARNGTKQGRQDGGEGGGKKAKRSTSTPFLVRA